MSDLVERVARALAKKDGIQICDDATYALSSYRGPALAAIATMQTDAAPVAYWYKHPTQMDAEPFGTVRLTHADKANGWTETPLYAHPPVAAPALKPAVKDAEIAALKDAEIAALKNTWQKQFDEKVRERGEAKLWFEKAQEWKQSLAALQTHADALAEALGAIASAETNHIRVNEGRIDQWTGSLQSFAPTRSSAVTDLRIWLQDNFGWDIYEWEPDDIRF